MESYSILTMRKYKTLILFQFEELFKYHEKEKAAKTAVKFAQKTTTDVEPMSAEEMRALIAQAKNSNGDDCLMCGS